jgi:hypothetical protein
MADGTAGVTRTDAESLDTKSPRHEWERGWKVVAVSLADYVFGSAGIFFLLRSFSNRSAPNSTGAGKQFPLLRRSTVFYFAVASPIVGRLADVLMTNIIAAASIVAASAGLSTSENN